MGVRLFSQAWADAVREQINTSRGFRRKGSGWAEHVVFAISGADQRTPRVAALLNLREGRCVEARAATEEDIRSATVVIASDVATWRSVLTGRADLLMTILRGRFRLERGTLAALTPYLGAAGELLDAAGEVDTDFTAG